MPWTILGALALFPVLAYAATPTPARMTEAQTRAAGRLPALTALQTDPRGIPSHITADLGVLRAEPLVRVADTRTLLASLRGVLRSDGSEQLRIRRENRDNRRGLRHYRMAQFINGLEVIGGEMIVHVSDATSRVLSIDAQFLPGPGLPAAESVSADDALRMALAESGAMSATTLSAPRLAYARTPDAKGHLVWAAVVRYLDPDGRWHTDELLVDAVHGRLVWRLPRVHGALDREVRNFSGGAIIIDEGGSTADAAAANVYSFSGDTYNYLYNAFGRDSWNGTGGQMLAYVHGTDWGQDNATFDCSYGVAQFGDGSGGTFGSFAVRDIVAHEWGHGVTCTEANLVYAGESGAMNEALSDILGAEVEAWVNGVNANTWLLGEGAFTPGVPGDALRYMSHPTLDGHSRDWYPQLQAGDDVHYGSGIGNLAFYLLSNGGSHPRSLSPTVVTGIGITKAARIFYLTLRDRLLSNDGYRAARQKTIETAIAEYGNGSAEHLNTEKAWTAVGIGPPLNTPTVSSTYWDYTRVRNKPPTYSGPITVTASGGAPPYTYAWQRVSGDSNTNAGSPSSATTSFTRPITVGGWWTSVWRCLVTDSTGQTAYSPNVNVSFEWETGN
jgi:vibriolysin